MIKFEHTEVVGWEAAIRGMRNPLESWEKSDSYDSFRKPRDGEILVDAGRYADDHCYILGPNDAKLMMKLRNAGTDHRKFMRYIVVYLDITAPLYWWKEFETYRAGVHPGQEPINPMDIEMNSCSTMHTIHKKEFTLDDFSHEHILDETFTAEVIPMVLLEATIEFLNKNRAHYLSTKDKKYWWQMIQLLPSSYNQKRTVMLNYEVLANIYKSRKDHKLDEWHEFCDWIKTLPYSELIVGKSDTAAEEKEEHPLPSMNEIYELFINVMKVDGRVKSYRVHDKTGMKILDFYDANHKSLYAVDLYRTTLDEALALIKEELVKLTRKNLEFGA